jgi:hypothetical protein
MKRPDSLAEVVRRVRNGRAFGPTLGEFLDDFYGQPDRRQTMTASMPWWVPSGSIWHVAGTSLFLAGQNHPSRFLHRPYFTTPIEKLKAMLLVQSPYSQKIQTIAKPGVIRRQGRLRGCPPLPSMRRLGEA